MRFKIIIKNFFKIVLVLIVFGLLFIGLIKTFFFPKEVNNYENRTAYQVEAPTLQSYLDGSFQDQFENAFNDQILFAQTSKKAYNTISSELLYTCMMPVIKNNPDRYISFMSKSIFGGDYVVYHKKNLEDLTSDLDQKISNINSYVAKHPEIDLYLYYIERDTDIDFETNEKLGAYEYLCSNLNLPENHMDKFTVNSFSDFSQNFFRTDHHWNYNGSYQGYCEVMNLLGEEDLMKPEETVALGYEFSGAKSLTSGMEAIFSEEFTAYRFDFPKMSVTHAGEAVEDYGKQDKYLSHTEQNISYGNFYGGDWGELILDTGNTEKENILVIGESFDNAILKLIATHYNRTYSIDLRNYEREMGSSFKMSEYMQEHDISKVLLIGNVDFYCMEEFNLED